MNEIPLGILQSPDNGLPLQWQENGQELALVESTTGLVYKIQSGVLNLLPHQQRMSFEREAEKSVFNYADHYEKDAQAFDYSEGWEDPASTHENKRLHQTILSKIGKSPKRVLDVGCGAAWVAAHFKGTGTEVFSMDISTTNPKRAVENYPSNKHFGIVADAFHLPFKNETFDAVIASEIIEHLGDPQAFLAALPRILSPGGVLVITTPHDEKLAYSLCVHCNEMTPHHAHLHSFTRERIKGLLPKRLQAFASTFVFTNKLLLKTRTHILLKYLPYSLWKMIDQLFNLLIPKTARLMLVVRKPK